MFLACSIRWMQVLQTCYGDFLYECRVRTTGHEAVRRGRPRTRRPGARSRCRTGSWPVDRQQDQGRRHESARPRRGFRTGSLAAMTLGRRPVLMRSRRRLETTAIVQVFGRRHRDRRHLLGRPASKKRQSTKSRGGLGGGRQPALWRFEFRAGYGGGRGVSNDIRKGTGGDIEKDTTGRRG